MDKPPVTLKAYGIEADEHWKEVMELAERYGFIVQAGGGTATLITHKNQLENYGETEYLRIQSMDGHCPKDCGYPGCSTYGGLVNCAHCWVTKKGPKWIKFDKNKEW